MSIFSKIARIPAHIWRAKAVLIPLRLQGISRLTKVYHFRVFAFLISLIYGWSNVWATHAVESSFWKERSENTRRVKAKHFSSNSSLLARLPPTTQVLAEISQNVPTGTKRRTANFVGQSSSSLLAHLPLSLDSNAWIQSLILPYGSIQEINLAKKPGTPLIVHIQDVHGIEEAQRNIASMIQELGENRGINLVGLESASGAFNFSPYRDWPDVSVTRDVAECFLKEGKIGGPEFVGMTAPHPPTLWGIENPDLYLGNVRALLDANKLKPEILIVLSGISRSVSALKSKYYSNELTEFDRHVLGYQEQKERLGTYVKYLDKSLSVNGSFPNLQLLQNALDAEDSLDFKRVEKERVQLVEMLAQRLSKAQLDLLVQRSFQCRSGRAGYGDYHRFLQSLCQENHVPMANMQQFTNYIEYVHLAEKIDRNKLLDELAQAEIKTQDGLAKSPEQKRLVAVSRRLSLMNKLSVQAMTPRDWAAYEKERESILNIGSDLATLSSVEKVPDSSAMSALIKPFEDFCRTALRRNVAFVENLAAELRTQNATSAVLVAGGFHTDGLTQLFRERDFSYVVVTPKITEVPKNNNYLDVFARDPLPLEKLFAGEEIFLGSARLPVVHPMTGDSGPTAAFVREFLSTMVAVTARRLGKPTFPMIKNKAEFIAAAAGAPMTVGMTLRGADVSVLVSPGTQGDSTIEIDASKVGHPGPKGSRGRPILRERAVGQNALVYRRILPKVLTRAQRLSRQAVSPNFSNRAWRGALSTITRGRMIVPKLLGGIGLALGIVALTMGVLIPFVFFAGMVVIGGVLHIGLARKWGWAESGTDSLTAVFLAGAMERSLSRNRLDRKTLVDLHRNADISRVSLLKALRQSMAIERLAKRIASRLAIRLERLPVSPPFNLLTMVMAQWIRGGGAVLGIVGHYLWHSYSNFVNEAYSWKVFSFRFAKSLTGYDPVRATTDIDRTEEQAKAEYDTVKKVLENRLGRPPLPVEIWTVFDQARETSQDPISLASQLEDEWFLLNEDPDRGGYYLGVDAFMLMNLPEQYAESNLFWNLGREEIYKLRSYKNEILQRYHFFLNKTIDHLSELNGERATSIEAWFVMKKCLESSQMDIYPYTEWKQPLDFNPKEFDHDNDKMIENVFLKKAGRKPTGNEKNVVLLVQDRVTFQKGEINVTPIRRWRNNLLCAMYYADEIKRSLDKTTARLGHQIKDALGVVHYYFRHGDDMVEIPGRIESIPRSWIGIYAIETAKLIWDYLETKIPTPLVVNLWIACEQLRKTENSLPYSFDPQELMDGRVSVEPGLDLRIAATPRPPEINFEIEKILFQVPFVADYQSPNEINPLFGVDPKLWGITEVDRKIISNLASSDIGKIPLAINEILSIYTFFYLKIRKLMAKYVDSNPLKVWGVMTSAIKLPDTDLLMVLEIWGYDRRLKEFYSVAPAPTGSFAEGMNLIPYDEYLESYRDQAIDSFREITGRQPTNEEIIKITSFAKTYYTGNPDGDGYTLLQSFLLHAEEIKNGANAISTHNETLKKGKSLGPLIIGTIGLSLTYWLGVWIAIFFVVFGTLLHFGSLLNWKWSNAIVNFITRTLLAGIMEFKELQSEQTFLVWVGKHAVEFQSEIAKAGRSFLKWQQTGESRGVAGSVAGLVGFLATVHILQVFITGMPVEFLIGMGAVSGAVSQSILWKFFSRPMGFMFHVIKHSMWNLGTYMTKWRISISRISVLPSVETPSSPRFDETIRSSDLEALLLIWEKTGNPAVLKKLVVGSEKVDWDGLLPHMSGAMQPTIAQLDPQAQDALSGLFERLGQTGIPTNVLESRIQQGLLVAGWRAILTSSPGGFLCIDASPLSDPINSETRMLVVSLLDAISTVVQSDSDQNRVNQVFIGVDSAKAASHIRSEFPAIQRANFVQNQLTGPAQTLAVGGVATQAKKAGASFLPVYTARKLDYTGTPEGINVVAQQYSLLEILGLGLKFIEKVLSFA